jgi:hypothetical protein
MIVPDDRPVPDARAGIMLTVDGMIRAALNGGADPEVRRNAERIMGAWWPGGDDRTGRVEPIFRYAQGTHPVLPGLRFIRDPFEREILEEAPMVTERRGHADADVLAVWLAAHLIAAGISELRFVLVAMGKDQEFHHVFVQALPPGAERWVSLDPTVDKPMGWEVPDAHRLWFIDIKRPAAG